MREWDARDAMMGEESFNTLGSSETKAIMSRQSD